MPQRNETVATEAAIDGVAITAVPAGAAAWQLTVQNDSETPIMLLWDESSFVNAAGNSGGRLIRGETRRIDSAKTQPPTPVPAHSRASEFVLVEKLADIEKSEADFAEQGFVTHKVNQTAVRNREQRLDWILGGRIDLRVEIGGEKRTWTGRVSGGKSAE